MRCRWCCGASAAWRGLLLLSLLMPGVLPAYVHGISSSNGPTVFTGLDINQFLGADRFYQAGYDGTRAIQANIEGGHIWAGHITLGHATVRVTGEDASEMTREHATLVGHAMGGRSPDGSYPDSYHRWGIAPGATLWSGAIAKTHFADGTFEVTNPSVATTYWPILHSGVNGKTADVFNSSWGYADPTGTHRFTIGVDGLIKAGGKIGVVAAGNDGAAGKVGGIAAGYNAISVAALGSDSGPAPYQGVSSFSSRGMNDVWDPVAKVTHAGVRAAVDIAAPGQNLTLAAYDNFNPLAYRAHREGTSFASPLVAGGASLLVDAGRHLYAENYAAGEANRAIDGRVVKAVLLNSADKIPGWNNGQSLVDGIVRTTQSLDWASGAGRMNLARAFDQYVRPAAGGQAGTTDLLTAGAAVAAVGWDFSELSLGEENLYYLASPLAGGSSFTATLAWFIDRHPGAATSFNAFADQRLTNLDLRIYQVDSPAGGNIIATVAESTSLYNTVEHLHFNLPADGYYAVGVIYTADVWNIPALTGEQYGLAWHATAIPEPAAAAIWLLAAVVLQRRGRNWLRRR
jgi:hypothetical protein